MALLIAAPAPAIAGAPAEKSSVKLGERPKPPKLPLAEWWSVPLEGAVSSGPVADSKRIYVAYVSGAIVARDAADGHEVWRQKKTVTLPMATDNDLLFVTADDAVEALRGATGASAWILPRTKTVAPLLAQSGWVIATTDTEVLAIRAESGEIAWRHSAGGVKLQPAIDDGHLYTGADDGRVLALNMADGSHVWDQYFPGGVTAIAAHGGRVYVGTGEKMLFCVEGSKKGSKEWSWQLGARVVGRIAVDDDRVYSTALDNVARAQDRENGNQRWVAPMRQRTTFGLAASGHVVFVAAAGANELLMLWDRNGIKSGSLLLPGDTPPGLPPAIVDSPDGPIVYTVTGGLTNEWALTKFAPAGEAALIPFAKLDAMPGLPYLTDPELKPLGNVLQLLALGDPLLQPLADADWPIVLRDPPLVPLTTVPGLQLRPLSPVIPVRRGASGPGG